ATERSRQNCATPAASPSLHRHPTHRSRRMPRFTFEHIHLRSPDPEATASFYEKMFGAHVIRSQQDGKPRVDLELGGMNVFIAPDAADAAAAPTPPYQG